MKAEKLYLNALNRVKHAVSTDESRPQYAAIFVRKGPDGAMQLLTTDGHRMAIAPANGALDAKTIEYTRAVQKRAKLRTEVDALAFLRDAQDLSGDYACPNIENALPKGAPDAAFALDKKALLAALVLVNGENAQHRESLAWVRDMAIAACRIEEARAEIAYLQVVHSHAPDRERHAAYVAYQQAKAALAHKKTEAVRPHCGAVFMVADGALMIRTVHPSPAGETEFVPGTIGAKARTMVTLNVEYAIEAVRSFRGSQIYVELRGDLDPVVFRDENGADVEYVMPMKV